MAEPQNTSPEQLYDLAPFREPQRAQRNFEHIRARMPQELLPALFPLLAESPDPDQALNLFERLVTENTGPLIAALNKNRVLLHYTIAIFGHSYWLGEALIQNQDIFYFLQREKNLERSLGSEDFRENLGRLQTRSLEADTSALLARFKKREYIRIALRDVLGVATLAETAAEISALSDVLIEEALRETESRMQKRYGAPEYQDAHGRLLQAPFAVMSLGKLGGAELNYSSDIDLLYLYGDQDTADSLSLREYFVRQSQLLTEILSRATHEGSVFRIDLRLRPQGNEGEPAVGLRHALNYYAHVAHDWELQALIKLRHSAGNRALARQFIRGVEPRVYTGNVNFEAIETALLSREKMGAHRRRLVAVHKQPDTIDVKLDRGGIRDIEFLAQCLQRVYGGTEKWLRPGGTMFSLQKLHDKGHISGKDFHDLNQAYEFLRKLEHRLQLQRARQLHRLPASAPELQVLQRAVDRNVGPENVNTLLLAVKTRMASVAAIYDRIIHRQKRIEKGELEGFQLTAEPRAAARELSFDQVLQRIAMDAPPLHEIAARPGLSLHARRSLHKFLSSALTSAERYAALLENPAAVARAIELFETSEYLTDILVRHPNAIRALNYLPRSSELLLFETRQEELFSGVGEVRDHSEALAMLRRNYRAYSFSSAARDVLQARPAYESMRENTRIADAAIGCALRVVDGEDTLAVFVLGRLGTDEFDIASDADLLFVRSPRVESEHARLAAEKLMHALAAYTREGTLFAVDTRLRPHGGEGELVITPAQMEKYLMDEAQPWEALTYTKLRFVVGDREVANQLVPLVQEQIARIASDAGFARAAVEMRARQEKSNRFAKSFKLARGGFYDIDFLASYLMLRNSQIAPESTNVRLQQLQRAGVLQELIAEELQQATVLYRTVDHAIRLVTGRARPELPSAEHARHATESLVNRILKRPARDNLQMELDATAGRVREIFNQVVT